MLKAAGKLSRAFKELRKTDCATKMETMKSTGWLREASARLHSRRNHFRLYGKQFYCRAINGAEIGNVKKNYIYKNARLNQR